MAAIVFASIATHASAQTAPVSELVVVDSKKQLESQVAAILQDRFKVNATLQAVGDDTDDLWAIVRVAPSEAQNLPAIAVQINSRITQRRNDNNAPLVQILSFASTADVTLNTEKELELLRLMNAINAQALPAHVYVAGGRIVAVQNVTLQYDAPLSAELVGANFVNVLRTWPSLMAALRQNNLLNEK